MTWLRVLSPNLGCPLLLEGKESLRIVCAWPGPGLPDRDDLREAFVLETARSYLRVTRAPARRVALEPAGPPRVLQDWQAAGFVASAEDTRRLLPRVVMDYLPKGEVVFFTLDLQPRDDLLEGGESYRLYDLVWQSRWDAVGPASWSRAWHAVQAHRRESGSAPVRLLHLTDLHVARRNDEILSQVSGRSHRRSLGEIQESFRNFNENARRAIAWANDLARRGELDFVVATGDLVDFAHFDWEDGPCPLGTNWDAFVEILTGTGTEEERNNPGLAVACFVTLGNHDWRLHPYPLTVGDYAGSFGLTREEADAIYAPPLEIRDDPASRRRRVWDLADLNVLADGRRLRMAQWLEGKLYPWIRGGAALGLAALGLKVGSDAGSAQAIGSLWGALLGGSGGAALVYLADWTLKFLTRKLLPWAVDSPLHASVHALYHYFLRVSPYLELAFRFRGHWFVLMDSGPDVFTAQLLDRKEAGQMKRMSLEDNILGGSPDSRGFVSDRRYRDWAQIDWLERVLAARAEQDPSSRCIVFLHAPPVNTDLGPEDLARLAERTRPDRPWVDRDEANLTYGTVAHHLSQFFYLCLGGTEAELRGRPEAQPTRPGVDLILCGHAHRNVEFRLLLDEAREVRIATDDYASMLAGEEDASGWWERHRPIVAQTAACGPAGKWDEHPPYGRLVAIEPTGILSSFAVRELSQSR